ncbi:VWA domain-containing protein [Micromonospora vinacea]|uniref:Ca-activated chloride channel family protein n=1 Tax=Micromonospora vinacea TaxID=709878 RepID=A0ABS0K297_9ACTN|nr:VWA domain-containing protein [Micromonospora vinacea]MBG6102722.1 Ca-activated chloride channel family protein [Micromonospora vinacea]WSZ74505.1 VWA domain-containing protein [Micromonospora sp. NBC_00860]WTA69018.1 VWA domain-containing protein [Micromonospora sp. NBC_00855]
MIWQSPLRLWLLLGVLALVVAYLVMQRRRSRYAVRFTNLRLLDRVAPQRPAWRRHVPAGLFLAMLALLVVGFARPSAEVRVPRERATVMVAVDVSTSMLATDVEPDRLAAAKEAARRFVEGLPDEFNVGLVAFAGSAAVLVPPGTDRGALDEGIDRLAEGITGVQGTAIGEAINTSLGAVKSLDSEAAKETPPARVILLSDGANTSGMDPMEAAAEAVKAEVPVHSISFGTPSGFVDRGGRPIQVPVDGQTLKAVAEETGGMFHEASTTDELRAVYEDIGSSVGYRTERQDVSARFIGLGLVFAMGAAAGSMRWFSRLP